MNLKKTLGVTLEGQEKDSRQDVLRYINLKLTALGCPWYNKNQYGNLGVAEDLISNYRERNRLYKNAYSPADQRIQNFLNRYFDDIDDKQKPHLPYSTFILDHYGLAREMSLPPDEDEFITDIISSYRVSQGVLHNPKNDRRTTKGVFHIAEGGLPIPYDKKAVPKETFAYLFEKAFYDVPSELMQLPFTASQEKHAELFVSLLLRPKVCPEVKGVSSAKSLEIRFFAPGNLVSNLDFVESIFGNAGNPNLLANDAGMDPEFWTGHSGCVVLAPHLLKVTKKEAGLPKIADATERQKRDGMCWEKEDELYNDGQPYKICCRDESGVIVTIITDNYFGYCKKEVKTQIGYSANLFGQAEEEHAGGALAFPCYQEGEKFSLSRFQVDTEHTMDSLQKCLGDKASMQADGYAIDTTFDDIIYLPEDASISLPNQEASWKIHGQTRTLRILPDKTYVYPTGFKIHLEKHPNSPSWRLVGTRAEGTLCHKPCTVSGGGKSEISKSIWDAIHYGSIFVADFKEDMKLAAEVIDKDYGNRLIKPPAKNTPSRSLLDADRSIGSVIKMLTQSSAFTEEFNTWLEAIPNRIKALVFAIKRFYKTDWADNWQEHFSVNSINGEPGHELHYNHRKLVGLYLRIGIEKDNSWRTFKLRQDYIPSSKIQWEDDISASVIVPTRKLNDLNPEYLNPSVKIVENCEYRFFQRPDDAIVRGYDKQAELDLTTPDTFVSNFQALSVEDTNEIYEKAVDFVQYTEPMQEMLRKAAQGEAGKFTVASDKPRIVNGKPTKNPRYLQVRPDVLSKRDIYLAEMGIRLWRVTEQDNPIHFPVNAVLPGRRNNPAEPGIRPLAVYNPVHYQELPELFMEFISSLTGKSPSTTGAGSEGALTKGPFNALPATSDLNNALLSFILTNYAGYSTAAGHIGTKYKVEHDVSLLVPELWCRMGEDERAPEFLKKNNFLEKVEDFEHKGSKVLASRLGYRITREFCNRFMGRIFDNPDAVFPEDMLKPELQSMDEFVDGINNIVEAQQKVAKTYIADGSVNAAIPPIKALLHIMAEGSYEGKDLSSPEIRGLFDYKYVIESDWYKDRLKNKIQLDQKQLNLSLDYLQTIQQEMVDDPMNAATRKQVEERITWVNGQLSQVNQESAWQDLKGSLGADILYKN
jgi:phosphoenolpyruvate carboxykinase (diphosphate)